MAITAYKYLQAANVADLNTAIATEIAASRYPIGDVSISEKQDYPAQFYVGVGVGTGAGALASYKVLQADTLTDLTTQVTAAIAGSDLPIGGLITKKLVPGNRTKYRYFQAVGH